MLHVGMKGILTALLDDCASDVDDVALAIAINSFLVSPVSLEEAFSIYVSLFETCKEDDDSIHEPLRSMFLNELRDVPPSLLAEKMRRYSLSIRKLLADSIASKLCRQHNTILEHLKGAVQLSSSEELLALIDGEYVVAPQQKSNFSLIPFPRRA